MSGYTAKKGNRYYAVIYEGVDPLPAKSVAAGTPGGPARPTPTSSSPTWSSARTTASTALPTRSSVGEYLTERWLPAERSQLKATTFLSYESNIRLQVLPTLGKVPLGRLAPEDLDALYGRLHESGRRNKSGDGPGLSPGSVRYVHRILRKALGDAVRKGTLNRNPASFADPPKRSTSTKREGEMHVWTSAQLQAFLASLNGERLAPAFVLAAYTGMRRGEVAGLRWADVDLDAELIHVRQNAVVVNYDARLTDVKTSHGRRTIDVNDDVVRALQGWRRKQAEERLLLGARYDNLVFARADGTLTPPRAAELNV